VVNTGDFDVLKELVKTFESGECLSGEWGPAEFLRKAGIQEFIEWFGKSETVSFLSDSHQFHLGNFFLCVNA
jgi:hypothetical protein